MNRLFKNIILLKTVSLIIAAVFMCQNMVLADSSFERNCLAPRDSVAGIAETAERKAGGLEEGYKKYRTETGSEDLSGWVSLGLVGAYFRDYVLSQPRKEQAKIRRQYRRYMRDPGSFINEVLLKTDNGKKIKPIRLDTVVSLQRSDVSYGINELVANGIDAVLKGYGMWDHLIGQFGEGFFLILKEFEEGNDPDDRLVLVSSTNGRDGIKVSFRKSGADYYAKFSLVKKDVKKGTRIRLYRKDFSKKVMQDGQEVSFQNMRDEKIVGAYLYNLSLPIMLNGGKEPVPFNKNTLRMGLQKPVNSINNFSGMKELFGNKPEYLVSETNIRINTYSNGYEIVDTGIGIDIKTLFEKLIIPRISSHDEERPAEKQEYSEEKMAKQMRLFYKKSKNTAEEIKMQVVLQVAGVCIERFYVKGLNLPELVVIELPRWTSVGGEGRNKILMDELSVRAFKYLISKTIELTKGNEQDLLINALAGIVREKQRVDKEVGNVKPDNDLLRFIYDILKDKIKDSKNEMILPNSEEFICFVQPKGFTKRYLDKDVFLLDPRKVPGILPITETRIFGRSLFLADLDNPEQIYVEWGSFIFIDRKTWQEAGKKPEHLENLKKHIEHNLSFYIGYGPVPSRARFEDVSAGEDVLPEQAKKGAVFNAKEEARRLVSLYGNPEVKKLEERIVMELEKAKDPEKKADEIKSFLFNLAEFLLVLEPYLEGINWVDLLFGLDKNSLSMDVFKLLTDFKKNKKELIVLLGELNERIGYEFTNGRNQEARKNLIKNIARLNIWHFDMEKISIFLPFMEGRIFGLLTRELLNEWYGIFGDESLENIRQFAAFFNKIAPVLQSPEQLQRYSQRWYKIFSRYRKHSRQLMGLLDGNYPYRGRLPGLPGEAKTKRPELSLDNPIFHPEVELKGFLGKVSATPDGMVFVTRHDEDIKIWERQGNKYVFVKALYAPDNRNFEISPDGKDVLIVTEDKIRIYDRFLGGFTINRQKDEGSFVSAVFSPSGKDILVVRDKSIVLENVESGIGRFVTGHLGEENYTLANFDPSGNFVAAVFDNGDIHICNVASGGFIELHDDETGICCAQFDPSGKYLLTVNNDHKAKIWDWIEQRCVNTIFDIESARFSPDGKYIITSKGLDGIVIWDIEGSMGIKTIGLNGYAKCAESVNNGKGIAVVLEKEGVTYLQLIEAGMEEAEEEKAEKQGPDWGDISTIQDIYLKDIEADNFKISNNGEFMVVESIRNQGKLYLLQKNKSGKYEPELRIAGVDAVFSPDSRYLMFKSNDEKSFYVSDSKRGFAGTKISVNGEIVNSLEFSPNGDFIVVGTKNSNSYIYNTDSTKLIFSMNYGIDLVIRSYLSPDNKYLVSILEDADTGAWNICVDDVQKGISVLGIAGNLDRKGNAQFTPDGKYLITTGVEGKAQIWDTEKWELRHEIGINAQLNVESIRFSPNGRYAILINEEDLMIEVIDLNEMRSIYYAENVLSFLSCFSFDSKYLFVMPNEGEGGIIKIIDIESGNIIKTMSFTENIDHVYMMPSNHEIAVLLTPEDDENKSHIQIIAPKIKSEDQAVEEGPDWSKIETGGIIKTLSDVSVSDIYVTDDKKYLVLMCKDDNSASVWKRQADGDYKFTHKIEQFGGFQCFDSKNKVVITLEDKKKVRLWELKTGKLVKDYSVENIEAIKHHTSLDMNALIVSGGIVVVGRHTLIHPDKVLSAEFSPDGKYLVTICVDNKVRIWSIEGQKVVAGFGWMSGDNRIIMTRFTPDGKYLIARKSNGRTIVYEAGSWKYINESNGIGGVDFISIRFSPDGKNAIFLIPDSRTIEGFDVLNCKFDAMHKVSMKVLADMSQFTPDGKYIITIRTKNNECRIFNAETFEIVTIIKFADDFEIRNVFLSASESEIVFILKFLGKLCMQRWKVSKDKIVKDESNRLTHIPGWRFLQDGVNDEQAPFDLLKYLRYIKPEHAEFLVEREPELFETGRKKHKIEDVELAKLVLVSRTLRNKVFKEDLTVEELGKLLKVKSIKNADLKTKREEIGKVILGQEDSFCLFLRELAQNSRDAINGEKDTPGPVDFTGFMGQGFNTLFSDFDEVRLKTSLGNGIIYYLTFVKVKDEKTGKNIIVIKEIKECKDDGKRGESKPVDKQIDVRSYIPKGKNEWIVSVTDPVGMDLFTIVNYLLTPDESLKKRKRQGNGKGKVMPNYWKGTEIQRVKYFNGPEDEPQLEALSACEYLFLYAGTVSKDDTAIYYNRFSEDEGSGELINEEKEKLSVVNTPQGDLTYYWCKKRKYNRITHKDLYFNDPQNYSAPDYTEFIPKILLDELYLKGLVIDIPRLMRLIRTRNALADENKHLLPLKKAIAIGAMKASIYLMLKHGIYIPTLPQDFYASVNQPLEMRLKGENVELAEKINSGKWDEIPSGIFERLADSANFGNLIQVMRNIKIEWADDKGVIQKMSLEDQRRKILEQARMKKSFEELKRMFPGFSEEAIRRMEDGYYSASNHLSAKNIYYKYTDEDTVSSPALSLMKRFLDLLKEAIESSWIENHFIYTGKPNYGSPLHNDMDWNVRYLIDNGEFSDLIKLVDEKAIDLDFMYNFVIWTAEEILSHEYRHIYEHHETAAGTRIIPDTHQGEKDVKGAFGFEQKKLLKKIIKNRFFVRGVVKQLRREFSKTNRKKKFGTIKWDVENLRVLAGDSSAPQSTQSSESALPKSELSTEGLPPCGKISPTDDADTKGREYVEVST